MLTKNIFHLIVIPDDIDPYDNFAQQQQSKYFGLILSFSILHHLTSYIILQSLYMCIKDYKLLLFIFKKTNGGS